MQDIMFLFSQRLKSALEKVNNEQLCKITEIRLRINKPIYVYISNKEYALNENGISNKNGMLFLKEDASFLWKRLCDGSPYSITDKQKAGYVTVKGNRIGFSGEFSHVDGQIRHVKNATSFCVRIKHEVKGCANKIYKYLYSGEQVLNTLIVSPPGCGKTTMLRDISRLLSFDGLNVGVVDEREELAAAENGIPTLDIGKRTDVFSGVNKACAIENMVRSIRPQVIIADEIGNGEDALTIKNAAKKGIAVIASIHGRTTEDIVCLKDVFERYIFLSDSYGIGTVEGVYNKNIERIHGEICC